MAKDRTRASSKPAAKGSTATRGRTRPPVHVVTPQRPWGLIVGAVVVAVFAATVLTYAVLKVNAANADKVTSADQIRGVKSYDYPAGQEHVATLVNYPQSPPVGGQHAPPPGWADCTGTVYSVDIGHENAVHSLEHGAVWITYNPDSVSQADIDTLAKLVENKNGRMLSPYKGLDAPISVQSWGRQLKLGSAGDKRIKQFADFFTQNSTTTPEPGATCQNPGFVANPVLAGAAGAGAGAVPSASPTGSSAPVTSGAP